MNIYTIHTKKNDKFNPENAIFIKEGFSLWAAIFQLFWAIYHGMWLCAAALFFAEMFFLILEKSAIMNELSVTVLNIGMFLLVGFCANDWRRSNLEKNGYELLDVVSAGNLNEAKQKFYASYAALCENNLIKAA